MLAIKQEIKQEFPIHQAQQPAHPPQPAYALMDHQVKAVQWMMELETSDKPYGILGMLMGLGKTFTMLMQIFLNREPGYPTLIVCPKTAIYTWEQEIKKFFGDTLRVFIFRNDAHDLSKVTADVLKQYDIVVTNYDFVRSLATKHRPALFDSLSHVNGPQCINTPDHPIVNYTSGPYLLFSVEWHRIVADESHNFSNLDTAIWKAMMCLCGSRRWCLSGTPIRTG